MSEKPEKKRRGAAMDLTHGYPLKCILLFTLPIILGIFVQQLYSLVDTVIVGQAIGAAALTGVGATGSLSFMILGFVSGLSGGFSVIISQRRGANDDEGIKKSFATGIILTLLLVSVLTVVALVITKPMLTAMRTKTEFFDYSVDYITTIFGGMLLSAFSNLFGSTLRAIGDSKVPLYFLIFSCFLNAGMDCLFVMCFGMGVRGAALATVLANGLTAAATFVYLWVRYPVLRFKPKHFKPNLKNYGAHLRLGLPMALQMSIVSIGMIFGQTALNTMEPTAVTAYVAATRIDGIASGILVNSASALSVFVGQNYGAERYDRIKSGVKQFTLLAVGVSVLLCGLVVALNRPLVMMFISRADRSEKLFSYALRYTLCNGGFYILLSTLCICRSSLQGMGRGTVALFSAAMEVAMRVGVSLIAIHYKSFTIVCLNNCFSWLGANSVLVPAFLLVLKKYIPLFGKAKTNTATEHDRLSNPETVIETEQLSETAASLDFDLSITDHNNSEISEDFFETEK
ncbi:MAG: MATE family efflux transporter [Clostridiales bacterium]|nr:MATE family efflux transporter [Clostridiales bacterium]